MTDRYLLGRIILLSFCAFLVLTGMTSGFRVGSVDGPSLSSIVTEDQNLQIASKAKQALIVTFPWFGEPPYSATRSILESKGVKVVLASLSVDPMPGYENKLTVKPDILLNQVHSAEYDAIVFIGSARYPGDNADAIRIAKEGAAEGKVLASYAMAISTLIKADVLNGKRVASNSDFAFFLQKAGATMSTATLEQDGRIITASPRSACEPFAEAIAAALTAGAN
jgi:hypothetical protein